MQAHLALDDQQAQRSSTEIENNQKNGAALEHVLLLHPSEPIHKVHSAEKHENSCTMDCADEHSQIYFQNGEKRASHRRAEQV